MKSFLVRLLTCHWLVTLLLMGLCGLAFGLLTINLYALLQANLTLLATHGAAAVMEGALLQLGELLLSGYLAVGAYILFKACEHVLVKKLLS